MVTNFQTTTKLQEDVILERYDYPENFMTDIKTLCTELLRVRNTKSIIIYTNTNIIILRSGADILIVLDEIKDFKSVIEKVVVTTRANILSSLVPLRGDIKILGRYYIISSNLYLSHYEYTFSHTGLTFHDTNDLR